MSQQVAAGELAEEVHMKLEQLVAAGKAKLAVGPAGYSELEQTEQQASLLVDWSRHFVLVVDVVALVVEEAVLEEQALEHSKLLADWLG
jgi:hypothetical protein